MAHLDHLLRYRDLIDDWSAFEAASTRPLPRVLWANPLRCDLDTAAATVARLAPQAQRVPWTDGAWRLPDDTPVGSWLSYRIGWLHAQEEAAMWAVDQLELSPGQRVLDLCAAPGNKTAQIAVALQDSGLIVATERRRPRLAKLRFNLERLGVSCAAVVHADGNRIADGVPHFDAALVDAPCSCEGTSRKHASTWRDMDRYRASISQLQTSLLRKALRLVRPGGVVVYSTCTYAPEENEQVLDSIYPEVAAIEPLAIPSGLVTTPGITEWRGRSYRPDVANAARLWPHHNDTGGFFVAKLRRLDGGDARALPPTGPGSPQVGPVPQDWRRAEGSERDELLAGWEVAFGVAPARFADHALWQRRSSGSWWIAGHGVIPDVRWGNVDTLGLRVQRGRKPPTQLSNPFLRRFFRGARGSVVELASSELVSRFFARETLDATGPTSGFRVVTARLDGQTQGEAPEVLGRGLASGGELRCELSKQDTGNVVV